jgi:23S rRNA (guanine745-N1)-methyltransferase
VEATLALDTADLVNLISMGPSAFHLSPEDIAQRVEALPRPFTVTASFNVTVWRPLEVSLLVGAAGEDDAP